MTFFDPKSDVLDIEFTQFGKYLLAQGKWNPAYYAFFDDDVTYDAQYAGIIEGQNSAQERITGSIRPRTQYAYAGIETEIKKQLSQLPWDGNEFERINLQPTADRDYALSLSMGRSDIGNENFPAWGVTFLNGELLSSVPHSTSSLGNIPIIGMVADNVVFKTEVKNKNTEGGGTVGSGNSEDCDSTAGGTTRTLEDISMAKSLNQVGESSPKVEPSDLILANKIYDDGSYISIEEDYLLLEILEENTPFDEENIEIQVFMHEENAKGQPVLTPLKFWKKKKMVVNDILVDDDEPELNEQAKLSPDYVEYFFNVWVDDEIDIETLCRSVVKRRNLGLYAPPLQCPEFLGAGAKGMVNYDCDEVCEECDPGTTCEDVVEECGTEDLE